MNLASALKPYKKEFDYSYTFGVFPTLELLANRSRSALGVLVHTKGEKNVGIRKLEEACRKRSIEFEVNDKVVERLSPKENSYVIGVFSKYELSLNRESSHVSLVNPSDMGNLGAIIRTISAELRHITSWPLAVVVNSKRIIHNARFLGAHQKQNSVS